MGLLDQVVGSFLGGSGGSSPLQNVLMNMLSAQQGQQGEFNQGQQGGYNQQQGGYNQQAMGGGLNGLLASFAQAGLAHIAQSWVSNGPNQPVSPDQLQSALGQNQVQSMANQAGMAPQDFLAQLSQHLPNVVNGLTPNGRVPDEGTISV